MDMEQIKKFNIMIDELVDDLSDKDIDFKILSLNNKCNTKMLDLVKRVTMLENSEEIKNKCVETLTRILVTLEEVEKDVATRK